jgi:hypothetical protein
MQEKLIAAPLLFVEQQLYSLLLLAAPGIILLVSSISCMLF